jgi:cytochrome c-type biogenesis protein CcmH/NrfG
MIPKILCPKCSTPVETGDKFCRLCGTQIDWPGEKSTPSPPQTSVGKPTTCPMCGHTNQAGAHNCTSCGAALGTRPALSQGPKKSFSFFQSWKFTVIVALLLVSVLVFYSVNNKKPEEKKNNPHTGTSVTPETQRMIDEIEALQKHVDASPNDTASVLRLANLLQDVRLYPRAVGVYQRYLTMVPRDPNALVDLGTAFFAMSFEDSLHRTEDIAAARDYITKAVTIAPKHQLGYFNLGIINFHAGETVQALEALKKCVAIDPASDAGKKAQQFLNQQIQQNPSSTP